MAGGIAVSWDRLARGGLWEGDMDDNMWTIWEKTNSKGLGPSCPSCGNVTDEDREYTKSCHVLETKHRNNKRGLESWIRVTVGGDKQDGFHQMSRDLLMLGLVGQVKGHWETKSDVQEAGRQSTGHFEKHTLAAGGPGACSTWYLSAELAWTRVVVKIRER